MKHYLRDTWQGWPALERKDASGAEGDEPDAVKAIEELSTALAGKMDGFTAELKKLDIIIITCHIARVSLITNGKRRTSVFHFSLLVFHY